MTDTLEEDHVRALLGLLAGNLAFQGKVFDSLVPDPTPNPPYVLVYSRVAWPRDGIGTGLDGVQDTITTTVTCHCVGEDAAAARVVAMQVRSSLLGRRPAVPNRNCGLIKTANNPDPPVRDESLSVAVFDLIAEYDFTTTG